MKLYDLPRESYFTLIGDTQIPPEARRPNLDKTYKLGNIDGMYSYCSDNEGNIYHFVAWAEIEKVTDNDSIQTFQEAYRRYLRTTVYQS
jgi:hypothetical protein